MTMVDSYREARHDEKVARLRRLLSLRAMVAQGASQREIAQALEVSQPAISQQLNGALALAQAHPETLLKAASPILARIASEHGYSQLAVFGSVARHQACHDSDIDLLVRAPEGTSSFDFIRFKQLLESVLGRSIDLVSREGLTPGLDNDIVREAVLL